MPEAPGAPPSFPGSSACTRGPFQVLSKLVTTKAWVGNYILFIHLRQGPGTGLRKSPQTTTLLCLCLLPHYFAESWVWLPSLCTVSHSDNKREKGGVIGAGWELHSGKPSFESTFFSKPQPQLPKGRLTHRPRLWSFWKSSWFVSEGAIFWVGKSPEVCYNPPYISWCQVILHVFPTPKGAVMSYYQHMMHTHTHTHTLLYTPLNTQTHWFSFSPVVLLISVNIYAPHRPDA